jgi:hypothetical protein
MAENIVAGLFGLTPQAYQGQQYQQDLKRGYELAQLSPGAAAQANLMASVGQLGRGFAGAMGIEDPQLKLISARNAIAQQIDQTNPESILKGAQMLSQMGDQQGAMALAEYYRKAQSETALAQQRTAAAGRERQQAINPNIQVSDQIANLKIGIERLQATPESPERNETLNALTIRLAELQRLTDKEKQPEFLLKEARLQELKAALRVQKNQPEPNKEAVQRLEDSIQAIEGVEKDPRFGAEREAIAGELFNNKSFSQLTPTEKAVVNKRIDDERGKTAEKSAPKVYAPEQPIAPKDWENFTLNVLSKDPIMQDTSKILAEGPKLINIIKNSTANDISAAALPKALASFIGKDSSLSNLDTATFARTGGLDDRLAADVNKFFTGRATEVKKNQAERFAIALYRGALIERKKKLETAAEEFGYETSPNYKKSLKNIDAQLAQFKLVKKGEKTPTATKTGNPLVDKWLSTDAEK